MEHSHLVVNHSAKQCVDGMAHANGIERVWALLKRGFYGTHHWFMPSTFSAMWMKPRFA